MSEYEVFNIHVSRVLICIPTFKWTYCSVKIWSIVTGNMQRRTIIEDRSPMDQCSRGIRHTRWTYISIPTYYCIVYRKPSVCV